MSSPRVETLFVCEGLGGAGGIICIIFFVVLVLAQSGQGVAHCRNVRMIDYRADLNLIVVFDIRDDEFCRRTD